MNMKATTALSGKRRIDMRPLKIFTTEKLPKDSIVRELISGERDTLTAQEFVIKAEMWLRLFGTDKSKKG